MADRQFAPADAPGCKPQHRGLLRRALHEAPIGIWILAMGGVSAGCYLLFIPWPLEFNNRFRGLLAILVFIFGGVIGTTLGVLQWLRGARRAQFTSSGNKAEEDADTRDPMSPAFKIIMGILGIIAVALILWLPYSPAYQQSTNMSLVEEYLPTIRPLVEADPRFAKVKVGVYTGLNGALYVGGIVEAEEDIPALQEIVNETHPPRPVHWEVELSHEALMRKWKLPTVKEADTPSAPKQ